MKKIIKKLMIILMLITLSVFFIHINRVEATSIQKGVTEMDSLTLPTESEYNYKDWKQTTIDYLNYVLDESNVYVEGDTIKKIGRTSYSKNIDAYFNESDSTVWSIPSYIGMGDDSRFGEGINVIAAILSGALVGLDMTNYEVNGVKRNYVKMMTAYYQENNGEHVVLNGNGTTTGNSFWYELLPGVLFSLLADQYESESYYMYDMVTEMARQWYKAVVALGGSSADFMHTSFNLSTLSAYDNGKWNEPDAAAGMAYILYAAYALNKLEGNNTYATEEEIEQFRQGAIWCMDYLNRLDSSPFYEVLTFLACYLAARLNAEQGTNYDVSKMISWTLDGSSSVRSGWGMIAENWGSHYTQGIMGSLTDGGGYAFLMNTFDAMLGFAPMIKYDNRFASEIAKWVLCVSQGAQSFYPENYVIEGSYVTYGNNTVYHGTYQSGNWIEPTDEKASFIAYEGLRKYRRYVCYNGSTRTTGWDKTVSPYASGDAFTFDWGGMTDYGLYGSSHVGLFGSTISKTNVKMILRTDLNALDFFSFTDDLNYYMYYNPYNVKKTVNIELSQSGNKLYNTLTKEYLNLTKVSGNTYSFEMAAGETIVLCEMGNDDTVTKSGNNYKVGDINVVSDRGSIDLNVVDEANNQVTKNSNVSGNIYATLTVKVPSNVTPESITLSFSGKVIYEGKTAPSAKYEIDTKTLKNGSGTLTATLTLAGGVVEYSTIPITVLNVVKDNVLSYDSTSSLVETLNSETTKWNSKYPKADHLSTVTENSDGSFTITNNNVKNWGFATTELVYLDFTREPIIELEVSECTDEFAVKVYTEDMEEPTGTYILRDTSDTTTYYLNVKELLLKEDRTLELDCAVLSSIKICATGSENCSVTIKKLEVYHMYQTPNLEVVSDYEWSRNFNSAWLSQWYESASEGAEGSPLFEYTKHNAVSVTANDEMSGVSSPKIKTDLVQNPVYQVNVQNLSGKYFAAVRFEGDSKLYVLEENIQTTGEKSFDVQKLLRANYSDYDKTGVMNLQIIIGAMPGSTVEVEYINTYYRLPIWGCTISADGWNDFIKEENVAAASSFELDSSNRFVVTNNGDKAKETIVAGVSLKVELNFDYNPEVEIIVRACTSKWRLTLRTEKGVKYEVTKWSTSAGKTAQKINLVESMNELGYNISGKQTLYFNIEVIGGGNTVTLQSMETYYTVKPIVFNNAYTKELLTWNKDSTNPSNLAYQNNHFVMSEAKAYSKGITSDPFTLESGLIGLMRINVSSLSEGAVYNVIANIDGNQYTLLSQIAASGTQEILFNDFIPESELTKSISIEINASGTSFVLDIESVYFGYKLGTVSNIVQNEGTVTWDRASCATSYNIQIKDLNGNVKRTITATTNTVDLTEYELPTGVYYIYITACADNFVDSDVVKKAIKSGDIKSEKLGNVSNISLDGLTINWDIVNNAEGYQLTLVNVDDNKDIISLTTDKNYFELSSDTLSSFNYELKVKAIGDGAVYLDGDETKFAFYENIISRYTAKDFITMSAVNNKAFAEYNENGYAVIQVPNNSNWGNVSSLSFTLNFSNCPVLYVDFADGSYGGYYLQIVIDGITYYLCDNTFDFTDAYFDINNILKTRKDGIGSALTGTHKVNILFGCTGDVITDDPKVNINAAYVYEMTNGQGTKIVGDLEAPSLSVDSKHVVSWAGVEHATSYILIVKNEFGNLIDTTITETSYDLSMLQREGEYTIEVTAIGDHYYNSEVSSITFVVSAEEPKGEKTGCGSSINVVSSLLLLTMSISTACFILRKREF